MNKCKIFNCLLMNIFHKYKKHYDLKGKIKMYSAMIHLLTIFNQKYKFFEKYKFANNKVYREKKKLLILCKFFCFKIIKYITLK